MKEVKDIEIKGDNEVVSKLLTCGISSVLVYHNILEASYIQKHELYDLTSTKYVCGVHGNYIRNNVLKAMELYKDKKLFQVNLCIISQITNEVLESWNFGLNYGKDIDSEEINLQNEIKLLERKIASSCCLTNNLDEIKYEIILLADGDLELDNKWEHFNPEIVHKSGIERSLYNLDSKLGGLDVQVQFNQIK